MTDEDERRDRLRAYRAEYAQYLDDPTMVAKLLLDRAIDGDPEAESFVVGVVADALAAKRERAG